MLLGRLCLSRMPKAKVGRVLHVSDNVAQGRESHIERRQIWVP